MKVKLRNRNNGIWSIVSWGQPRLWNFRFLLNKTASELITEEAWVTQSSGLQWFSLINIWLYIKKTWYIFLIYKNLYIIYKLINIYKLNLLLLSTGGSMECIYIVLFGSKNTIINFLLPSDMNSDWAKIKV